jgi:hypothetical protein
MDGVGADALKLSSSGASPEVTHPGLPKTVPDYAVKRSLGDIT